MNIRIIRKLEQLDELKNDWINLVENQASFSIFEHFDWIRGFYSRIEEKDILLLLMHDADNKLVGIFPFAVSTLKIKGMQFKALVHASGNSADFSSFVISKEINRKVSTKRIVSKLIEIQPGNWDFFMIDRLNDADAVSNLFRSYLSESIHGTYYVSSITPCIRLNEVFGEAKKLSNVSRRFKKLLSSSSIDITIDIPAEKDTLRELRELHSIQFPGAGFSHSSTVAFVDDLISSDNFAKYISVSTIRCDGKIIAGHFGFKFAGKFYYYVPVYDRDYKSNGPGQYLLMHMINHFKEKDYLVFDFLRGDEDYKDNWANTLNHNYAVFGVSRHASFYLKLLTFAYLFRRTLPL